MKNANQPPQKSNAERLSEKIPEEYRKEMVELQIIEQSQPVAGNESMDYLGKIWKAYIDPYWDPTCNMCYERVLNNFRKMLPVLQEMHKGDELLDKL